MRVRNDFLNHSQILLSLSTIWNSLNCFKIVLTVLYDSVTAYSWGFTSIIQLSTDQLFIFSTLWSLMLQCRVVILWPKFLCLEWCTSTYVCTVMSNVHNHNGCPCPIDMYCHIHRSLHPTVYFSDCDILCMYVRVTLYYCTISIRATYICMYSACTVRDSNSIVCVVPWTQDDLTQYACTVHSEAILAKLTYVCTYVALIHMVQ